MLPRKFSVLSLNCFSFLVLFASLFASLNDSFAADSLPYGFRTHGYSGYSTTAIGDLRTVGMGGATVGLADTFLAATSNPAGLGMTVKNLDTNITKSQIKDGNLQNYDGTIAMQSSLGLAMNIYPWGFSLGITPIGKESQSYLLPATARSDYAGQTAALTTESHDLRMGVSRIFFDNRLSLGMSLNLGMGEIEIDMFPQAQWRSDDRHAVALGATLGAMYRFDHRILLGLSYTTPMKYDIDSIQSPAFPNFFQPVYVPSLLSLGLGWIPNRFLRASAQLTMVGKTEGVALLSNDSRLVGDSVTLQPRLGVAYVFMDYKDFQGTVYAGGYYEVSRIQETANRFHKTFGAEAKAWLFTTGVTIDSATNYQNLLFSLGIDLGVVLEDLRLIPVSGHEPPLGVAKNPFYESEAGLAKPLAVNYKSNGPDMNPIKIIAKLPERTGLEVKRIGTAINKGIKKFQNAKPKAKKKAHRSRRKKWVHKAVKNTEKPIDGL